MAVIVTTHAIDQARNRVHKLTDSSTEDIAHALTQVAIEGVCTRHYQGYFTRNTEVSHNDIYIIVRDDPKTKDKVIVTCLGDGQYHRWLAITRRNQLDRIGHFRARKHGKPARAL